MDYHYRIVNVRVIFMYVCVCHAVTDKALVALVKEQQITDFGQIRKITRLGTTCGKCVRVAREVVETARLEVIAAQPTKKAS